MQDITQEQAEHVSGATSKKRPPVTTLAIGEEGGGVTSMYVGEEGGVTTMIYGEEGPIATTLAIGEEGTGPVATTAATSALGAF